jgi:hypothetical protein
VNDIVLPTLVAHSFTLAATREPKLQAARRIVSEWPEYDAEVAKFTERASAPFVIEDGKPSQSHAEVRTVADSERYVVSQMREDSLAGCMVDAH